MKFKPKGIREGSRIATVIMYVLAVFVIFITLYPMYYVLILSISDPRYAMTMRVYTVPKGFEITAYKILTADLKIWRSFANTVMYAALVTVGMVVTSILGAFPLTYKSLLGRKYVNMFLLITMFFSGGLIPNFLLLLKLGMYNKPTALIVPFVFSVWNIILTKAFLSSIPETLREVAKIDGANVYQTLLRIYIPLATPIMAVVAVYTIVGTWNSWFPALVYMPGLDWQPLQLLLRRMLVLSTAAGDVVDAAAAREMAQRQMAYAQLKYAMIIFSSLPVLFTYPFFQKYFIKGIMLGSLKE
ncbi:MAG: carbohydrate ABC transporter permease [Treponema sp.]|jgi:putative aldouronate transport system permease protein|nr:carbohydrate ABC transporter permease [Treponema sp.]